MRNLERDEVPKRYGRDGEPPRFGRRVKSCDYGWGDDDDSDGLSVNELTCACTPACALLLHPKPGQFKHVAIIDIVELSRALNTTVVAVYDPNPDDVENPCHYNLWPPDQSLEHFKVQLKRWADDFFGPRLKVPRTEAEIEQAKAEQAAYERVFEIRLDVVANANATGMGADREAKGAHNTEREALAVSEAMADGGEDPGSATAG